MKPHQHFQSVQQESPSFQSFCVLRKLRAFRVLTLSLELYVFYCSGGGGEFVNKPQQSYSLKSTTQTAACYIAAAVRCSLQSKNQEALCGDLVRPSVRRSVAQ